MGPLHMELVNGIGILLISVGYGIGSVCLQEHMYKITCSSCSGSSEL